MLELTKKQKLILDNTDFSSIQLKFCSKKSVYYFVRKKTLCNPFKTKFKYYTGEQIESLLSLFRFKIDTNLFLTPILDRSDKGINDGLAQSDLLRPAISLESIKTDVDQTNNQQSSSHERETRQTRKVHRFWGDSDEW